MSSAVKLSDELVASARSESQVQSRSMTQQIEHWARIGRAVERTGVFSGRVRAALRAELAYDSLSSEERHSYLSDLERQTHLPRGDRELAKALKAGEA